MFRTLFPIIAAGLMAIFADSMTFAQDPHPPAPATATVLTERHPHFTALPDSLEFLTTLKIGEAVEILRAGTQSMVYVKAVSDPERQGWTEISGLDLSHLKTVPGFRDYRKGQRAMVTDKLDLEATEPSDAPATLYPGTIVEIVGNPLRRSISWTQYPVIVLGAPESIAGMATLGTAGWADLKSLKQVPDLEPQADDTLNDLAKTPQEERDRRTLLSAQKDAEDAQYSKDSGALEAQRDKDLQNRGSRYDQDLKPVNDAYEKRLRDLQAKYDQDSKIMDDPYGKLIGGLQKKYEQDLKAVENTSDGTAEGKETKREARVLQYQQEQASVEKEYKQKKQNLDEQFAKDRFAATTAYNDKSKALDEQLAKDRFAANSAHDQKMNELEEQNKKDLAAIQDSADQKAKALSLKHEKAARQLQEAIDLSAKTEEAMVAHAKE